MSSPMCSVRLFQPQSNQLIQAPRGRMESDEEDAMVVEELVMEEDGLENDDDDDNGDALGDEQEELSLLQRLHSQAVAMLHRQHHPTLDHDTEDEHEAAGVSPRSSTSTNSTASSAAGAPALPCSTAASSGAARSAAAAAGAAGHSNWSTANRVGPSEAVRAALRALRHDAPAVELVPLLAAARAELEEYLFRCPVPHKVGTGRSLLGREGKRPPPLFVCMYVCLPSLAFYPYRPHQNHNPNAGDPREGGRAAAGHALAPGAGLRARRSGIPRRAGGGGGGGGGAAGSLGAGAAVGGHGPAPDLPVRVQAERHRVDLQGLPARRE